MLEVKQFPRDMSTLEVDRTDAKHCLISGLFEESVKVGDTQRRYDDFPACPPGPGRVCGSLSLVCHRGPRS